tara:strand:- start:1555 stop:1998 length:444 start_codon:yes stop_codon:yes gene_type:complete
MSYNSEKYHREYKQNEISTSDQGKLILMMYEGAIKNLRLAQESMKNKDLANKGLYIQKTHDIVNELSFALDMKKGGDVAERLEQLYQYILRQLMLANIKRTDETPTNQALAVLNTLQSAWQEIIIDKNDPKNPKELPPAKQKFIAHC